MTRNDLRLRILRNLGAPMIKVELCMEAIDDAINEARDRYIYWAAGDATQDRHFLLLLEAGKRIYDMPAGITNVVSYSDKMGGMGLSGIGGVNPLWYTGAEMGSTSFFAIQNPMMTGFTNGGSIGGFNGSPIQNIYTPVDTYLMKNMAEMFERFRPNKYNWTYHKSKNVLELHQTPPAGVGIITRTEIIDGEEIIIEVDSPGYVLIRAYFLEGTTLPTYVPALSASHYNENTMYPRVDQTYSEDLFNHFWIVEYATAYAKHTLGLIRRKLSNVTALGNASVSLDGDQLISEAKEEMQRLEEDLDNKYAEGFGISMA